MRWNRCGYPSRWSILLCGGLSLLVVPVAEFTMQQSSVSEREPKIFFPDLSARRALFSQEGASLQEFSNLMTKEIVAEDQKIVGKKVMKFFRRYSPVAKGQDFSFFFRFCGIFFFFFRGKSIWKTSSSSTAVWQNLQDLNMKVECICSLTSYNFHLR